MGAMGSLCVCGCSVFTEPNRTCGVPVVRHTTSGGVLSLWLSFEGGLCVETKMPGRHAALSSASGST